MLLWENGKTQIKNKINKFYFYTTLTPMTRLQNKIHKLFA